MKSTSILYFKPEAYLIDGPKLMGRNAAGNSFLNGYLRYASANKLRVIVDENSHAAPLTSIIQSLGIQKHLEIHGWSELNKLLNSIVYFPGPTIDEFAWRRYTLGPAHFSLCGITHTTASHAIMDSVCSWLQSPIYEWDAVICTSQVVKDTISKVLEAQQEYLVDRYDAKLNFVLPQLPVIPLGINSFDFIFTAGQKLHFRTALGINAKSVVILFSGRLSFHAKAHPLAMYQALGSLSNKYNLVLIECGWHANDFIADAYQEAFRAVCPGIKHILLDGRVAEQRNQAWGSADLFCSLSDNIQETFGLTPIEAMAAGLPSVVSDWNGYKDTVRHGIDGFRIPTYQPPEGLGDLYARSHELLQIDYDQYCGLTSQLIAVDVHKTIEALNTLISNPELRMQMGCAARMRAQTEFDWATIIPRYEALWSELDARRVMGAISVNNKRKLRPSRLDPFVTFSSYPSQSVDLDTILALGYPDQDLDTMVVLLDQLRSLKMINFAPDVQISSENARVLFHFLMNGHKSVRGIISLAPESAHFALHRSLLWLLKLGLLRVV